MEKIKNNKDYAWIDENRNDRITVNREDFEDELDRALYYGLISKKAYTGLLSWFDGYKSKK